MQSTLSLIGSPVHTPIAPGEFGSGTFLDRNQQQYMVVHPPAAQLANNNNESGDFARDENYDYYQQER